MILAGAEVPALPAEPGHVLALDDVVILAGAEVPALLVGLGAKSLIGTKL